MTVLKWLTVLGAWTLLASAVLGLSLVATSPAAIGPAGVTTWFVLLFTDLACLIVLALYMAKSYLHIHSSRTGRLRYSWRQGLLIGGWLTALLALSSLRQLGYLDAILLGLLLLIVEIYVRFRWP